VTGDQVSSDEAEERKRERKRGKCGLRYRPIHIFEHVKILTKNHYPEPL